LSGEDRTGAKTPSGGPIDVAGLLQHGLDVVEDLSRKLQDLDNLMLTGKAHEISDAALLIEAAIKESAPAFESIATAMSSIGAQNLQTAAAQLRAAQQNDAAGLAEALRRSLARFAQKSVGANRRAQNLNRGLNAALRTLHSFGVQESGRLIAEA
jgi:GH24 family phage-related lysozyme (muramidase)